MVASLGLTQFEAVIGRVHGVRYSKAESIEGALQALRVPARDAVMVGDRLHDIEGAHACGLPALGVTYGYGSRNELTAAGADALADTPADAVRVLLGRSS